VRLFLRFTSIFLSLPFLPINETDVLFWTRCTDVDQPFEMDEDVDVDSLDLTSTASSAILSPPSRTLDLESNGSPHAAPPSSSQQPSSSFKPGSFQRASALSASYAALLNPSSSARSSPSAAALSPSISTVHSFGSPSHRPSSSTPLSPPTTTTSSTKSPSGKPPSSSGPDPRTVRLGEQKIRDVLAMDVPSHRPRAGLGGRRASLGGDGVATSTYTPDANSSDESPSSGDEDERADHLNPLAASSTSRRGGTEPKMQVGSLPIALGRPSALQTGRAALSSWRPDPEREWAAERERELRKGNGVAPTPQVAFGSLRSGGGAGGGAVVGTAPPSQGGWTGTTTAPLEIGSTTNGRTASSVTTNNNTGGGGGASSSLAQSLCAGPSSFSARAAADAESRFPQSRGAAQRTGRAEPSGTDALPEEGEGEEGDEEEEDEDDGEFVPPHLVEQRRKRRDEEWLSRSVSQS
jgi:hypothetical protein